MGNEYIELDDVNERGKEHEMACTHKLFRHGYY